MAKRINHPDYVGDTLFTDEECAQYAKGNIHSYIKNLPDCVVIDLPLSIDNFIKEKMVQVIYNSKEVYWVRKIW